MPANISTDRGQTVVAPETLAPGTVIKVYPSVPLPYVRGLRTLAVPAANVLSFASTTKILVGDAISGTNVAGSSAVTAVGATSLTLNHNVTGNVASGASITLTRAVVTTAASSAGTTVAVPSTTNLAVGDAVTGTDVAASSTIASITDATHIVLNNATTSTGIASGATLTFTRTLTTNAATTTSSTAPLNLVVTMVPCDGLLGTSYEDVIGAVVYNDQKASFTELAREVAKGRALIPMSNVTPGAPTYV